MENGEAVVALLTLDVATSVPMYFSPAAAGIDSRRAARKARRIVAPRWVCG
jgi:hypothetical protein